MYLPHSNMYCRLYVFNMPLSPNALSILIILFASFHYTVSCFGIKSRLETLCLTGGARLAVIISVCSALLSGLSFSSAFAFMLFWSSALDSSLTTGLPAALAPFTLLPASHSTPGKGKWMQTSRHFRPNCAACDIYFCRFSFHSIPLFPPPLAGQGISAVVRP